MTRTTGRPFLPIYYNIIIVVNDDDGVDRVQYVYTYRHNWSTDLYLIKIKMYIKYGSIINPQKDHKNM